MREIVDFYLLFGIANHEGARAEASSFLVAMGAHHIVLKSFFTLEPRNFGALRAGGSVVRLSILALAVHLMKQPDANEVHSLTVKVYISKGLEMYD